ncbi:hypothetical protein FDC49_19885 [Clostridium sporogenes]|uniref:hypothetical protein n=1 Tax=Clostridium sporogenes TaxID=1509 RepID=UPI0013D2A78F|nr:hypothetical protein [Clostridium sporogenes]NFH34548.1 hypothetical protein [Clostridium sporogenes]NFL21956.1 hypothetical protein [Clostridium sporogenes]NFN74560.1 hypothetical protein [Clostridium sporogenes]NFV23992.1 hypothetical protein [Clostridium sporogenes]
MFGWKKSVEGRISVLQSQLQSLEHDISAIRNGIKTTKKDLALKEQDHSIKTLDSDPLNINIDKEELRKILKEDIDTIVDNLKPYGLREVRIYLDYGMYKTVTTRHLY